MSEDKFPSYALPMNWQDRLDKQVERNAVACLILVMSVLAMVACIVLSPTL